MKEEMSDICIGKTLSQTKQPATENKYGHWFVNFGQCNNSF